MHTTVATVSSNCTACQGPEATLQLDMKLLCNKRCLWADQQTSLSTTDFKQTSQTTAGKLPCHDMLQPTEEISGFTRVAERFPIWQKLITQS